MDGKGSLQKWYQFQMVDALCEAILRGVSGIINNHKNFTINSETDKPLLNGGTEDEFDRTTSVETCKKP